jgi:hypothetical protein
MIFLRISISKSAGIRLDIKFYFVGTIGFAGKAGFFWYPASSEKYYLLFRWIKWDILWFTASVLTTLWVVVAFLKSVEGCNCR